MAIDVVGVVIITVDITMDVDMAMPGADKQAGETNGVAIMTGARSSQRSEVRTYDRAATLIILKMTLLTVYTAIVELIQ